MVFALAVFPSWSAATPSARSLDQLMKRIREAIELFFEVQQENGERSEFVRAAHCHLITEQIASVGRTGDLFRR